MTPWRQRSELASPMTIVEWELPTTDGPESTWFLQALLEQLDRPFLGGTLYGGVNDLLSNAAGFHGKWAFNRPVMVKAVDQVLNGVLDRRLER